MTEAEQASLRQALITRLTQLVRTVRADLDENIVADWYARDPADDADESVRDAELDYRDRLDERDAALAQQIEGALERMRDGSYGRCAEDDEPIPLARLRAVPWAERCAEHQAEVEKPERHATL